MTRFHLNVTSCDGITSYYQPEKIEMMAFCNGNWLMIYIREHPGGSRLYFDSNAVGDISRGTPRPYPFPSSPLFPPPISIILFASSDTFCSLCSNTFQWKRTRLVLLESVLCFRCNFLTSKEDF